MESNMKMDNISDELVKELAKGKKLKMFIQETEDGAIMTVSLE